MQLFLFSVGCWGIIPYTFFRQTEDTVLPLVIGVYSLNASLAYDIPSQNSLKLFRFAFLLALLNVVNPLLHLWWSPFRPTEDSNGHMIVFLCISDIKPMVYISLGMGLDASS